MYRPNNASADAGTSILGQIIAWRYLAQNWLATGQIMPQLAEGWPKYFLHVTVAITQPVDLGPVTFMIMLAFLNIVPTQFATICP